MLTFYPYKIYLQQVRFGEPPIVANCNDWVWVFDDVSVGLVQDAIVSGTDKALDHLVRDIPNANTGFKLTVSTDPFEHCSMVGYWLCNGKDGLTASQDGNWYRWAERYKNEPNIVGWVSTNIFRYFTFTPQVLYIGAEPVFT